METIIVQTQTQKQHFKHSTFYTCVKHDTKIQYNENTCNVKLSVHMNYVN